MDLSTFTDRQLWDLLDDVAFWVKDREGRFVWVNLTLAEQAQASREAVIGTRDSDWFFNELASVYMQDDARLMKDRQPIRNKAELVMSPEGEVRWYATSKFPHVNADGELLGSYGMSRPMDLEGGLPAEYVDLSEIVTHARTHLACGVSVESLARVGHMSLSTLERTVRKHLKMTPQELLQQIRMRRARHLLTNSSLQIGEIALECGYESFSAFSRAFKKTYGCAPGTAREH